MNLFLGQSPAITDSAALNTFRDNNNMQDITYSATDTVFAPVAGIIVIFFFLHSSTLILFRPTPRRPITFNCLEAAKIVSLTKVLFLTIKASISGINSIIFFSLLNKLGS